MTALVASAVKRRGLIEGAVSIFVPHTTAAVTINEGDDRAVMDDVEHALARMVPDREDYRHAEGNSPAHVRSVLVSPSVVVPVAAGKLALGTWQAIFFCEFDGPRERQIQLTYLSAG